MDSIIQNDGIKEMKQSITEIIDNKDKSNKVIDNYQYIIKEKQHVLRSRGDFIKKNVKDAKYQEQRNLLQFNPGGGEGLRDNGQKNALDRG